MNFIYKKVQKGRSRNVAVFQKEINGKKVGLFISADIIKNKKDFKLITE